MKTTPDDYRVRYTGQYGSAIQLPDGRVIAADRWGALAATWNVKDGAIDPFRQLPVRGLPTGRSGDMGLPMGNSMGENSFTVCGISAQATTPTVDSWFRGVTHSHNIDVTVALHTNGKVYRETTLQELLIEGGLVVSPRRIPEAIAFGVFVVPSDRARPPESGRIVFSLWGFGVADGVDKLERDRFVELAAKCHR